MSTQLAKQIFIRMKAKNLSIAAFEREAGLKPHALQNILRGKSKKPNVELVQTIADALGCTIRDLLKKDEFFQEQKIELPKETINNTYHYPDLLMKATEWVNNRLKQQKNSVTIKQVFTCIEDIYLHSLQKDPSKIDHEFAEWFFDLVVN